MSGSDPRIARREFLLAVGKAAGSAAMLRTAAAMGIATTVSACGSSSASPAPPASPGPPPPPPNRMMSPRPGDWPTNAGVGRSVVILGGGIAGMTAALEMNRLGYSCTVLEATSSAGGRNRTIRAGDSVTEVDSTQQCLFDVDEDLYFNAGPSRIAHHHEFLLGYCREFGVALETFTNDNRAALLHNPSAFGGQPQLARRVISDKRGFLSELLVTAVNQGALDLELNATDRANLLQMLARYGDLVGSSYSGSSRSGFPGQEDTGSRQRGEALPPLDFSELIADQFWELRSSFSQGFEQQPTMLQPVGGMDRIARAFEAQVINDLLFDAVVSEIRKTGNGVSVVYNRMGATNSFNADYCIVTIPAPVLASIPNDFSSAHQAAISNFQYTSAVRLAFQSRRFWEQDHNIYGGISWTSQPITQLWYPNHGFGRQDGVMLGAYIFGGPDGDQFTAQTPQQRVTTAISQGSNVHPEMATEASRGISVAWQKVPFQLGGWGVSDPGILLTPDDNIVFAGEHLSILQGWQEGAILSAYHAIDAIVAQDAP